MHTNPHRLADLKRGLLNDMLRRVSDNVEVCAVVFERPMYATSLAILTTSALQRVVEAAGQWLHQQMGECPCKNQRSDMDVSSHQPDSHAGLFNCVETPV